MAGIWGELEHQNIKKDKNKRQRGVCSTLLASFRWVMPRGASGGKCPNWLQLVARALG